MGPHVSAMKRLEIIFNTIPLMIELFSKQSEKTEDLLEDDTVLEIIGYHLKMCSTLDTDWTPEQMLALKDVDWNDTAKNIISLYIQESTTPPVVDIILRRN